MTKFISRTDWHNANFLDEHTQPKYEHLNKNSISK